MLTTIAPEIGLRTVSHWIGGKVVASASGRRGTVWNPATGEAAAHVDFADAHEVDLAVDRAEAAFPGMARDTTFAALRNHVPAA